MCDMAKERHRALAVSVFHFTVGRAHSAERLDAALGALRDPRSFAPSQLAQRMLPGRLKAGRPDIERLLLRNDANAHLAVSINGKRIHAAATGVHGSVRDRSGRAFQIMPRQIAVLHGSLWRVHIERDHFFWRQPHSQGTLRTINPRVDLSIELEL